MQTLTFHQSFSRRLLTLNIYWESSSPQTSIGTYIRFVAKDVGKTVSNSKYLGPVALSLQVQNQIENGIFLRYPNWSYLVLICVSLQVSKASMSVLWVLMVSTLQILSHRRNVASLMLHYRYFHGKWTPGTGIDFLHKYYIIGMNIKVIIFVWTKQFSAGTKLETNIKFIYKWYFFRLLIQTIMPLVKKKMIAKNSYIKWSVHAIKLQIFAIGNIENRQLFYHQS